MLWVKMSLGDLKDWIMVSDTFNITALIIWIVRTIIYIFFIGIKQTVYIKPMITRVPVSISVGTRGTRELLMSLLVEALVGRIDLFMRQNQKLLTIFRRRINYNRTKAKIWSVLEVL